MPEVADPNNTFDLWLSSDAEIPQSQRPVLTYRIITGRQYTRLGELLDQIDRLRRERDGFTGIVDATYQAAGVNLVGWRNMSIAGEPLEFDPAKLPDLLGVEEAEELIERIVMRARGVNPDEEQEVTSPPCSATAAAAGAAAPADASTPAAPSSPC